MLGLELALLVSRASTESSTPRSVGGTGPASGPLRAVCVQGNTSENHRETVVSTANLSDVPCSMCPLPMLFHVSVRNHQLGKLNGICDTAAAMSRHRASGSSSLLAKLQANSILVSGLDPTPNYYTSCSPSVLTNLFFTALELN